MSIELWIAFVAATAVLLAIPGPTILTVVSYSLSHGRAVRVPLVAAVGLGDATALLLSLVGLGAVLATSAFWFGVIKWVGGLYLITLGLRLMRAGLRPTALSLPAATESTRRLFFNTWLVTALNPKGIVFFVAFLPQFVDPSRPAPGQLWLLAATFVVMAVLNAGLYAVFAGAARRWLDSDRRRRLLDLGGGALLTAAGLWALSLRRGA